MVAARAGGALVGAAVDRIAAGGRDRARACAVPDAAAGEPWQYMHACLRTGHPVAFLNVVSSFVGFGEATDIELPPLHLKLADMAGDRCDVHNALFLGLAEMAPHADDRVHARSLAEAMTDDERARLPGWLFELRAARPIAALRTVSVDSELTGEADLWFIEVGFGGHRATALLGIDDESGLPAGLAGMSERPLEHITSMAIHPSSGVELAVNEPCAVAGRQMLDALDRGERLGIAPAVAFWPEPRALLRWAAGVALR